MASSKTVVSLRLFSTYDTLEFVHYDLASGNILACDTIAGTHDPETRQVIDPEQFMGIVEGLYKRHNISLKTNTVVVLPSMMTRQMRLEADIRSREELRMIFLSEAERFYLFKQLDPEVSWLPLDEMNGDYLFSAQPALDIDHYVQSLHKLGIPLQIIDLEYTSLIRALATTGAVSTETANNSRWYLLVVADRNVAIFSVQDTKIERMRETLLSEVETNPAGALMEIQQDLEGFAGMDVIQKLVLVNNSQTLKTDTLAPRLNFAGELVALDQNPQALRARGGNDGLLPCSLEGLGGALYVAYPDLPHLNFLPADTQQALAAQVMQKKLEKGMLALNLAVLGLFFVGFLILQGIVAVQENKLRSIQSSMPTAGLEGAMTVDLDKSRVMVDLIDQNMLANNLMIRAAIERPTPMWINEMEIARGTTKETQQVRFEGLSTDAQVVNRYMESLRQTMNAETLNVGYLNNIGNAGNNRYYEWRLDTTVRQQEGQPQ